MSYERDILEGLASLLAATLSDVEWKPAGVYAVGDPRAAISLYSLPDLQRPIIALSPYPVLDAWQPNDSVLGVQVRTRCESPDPHAVADLDDGVYAVLHGLSNLALSGHRITKIARQSGASMGQDSNRRWGRSSNYYVTGPR